MARFAAVSAVALVGLATGQTDDCSCLYQGSVLPATLYTNYPQQEAGKYKDKANIGKYGTTCAAWDQVPDTPWSGSCPPGSDWKTSEFNWCQLPWCYVGSSCSTKIATSVFNGSDTAFYSYAACGNTPDCYNNFATATGCPYDPSDEKDYKLEKKSCACKYQGLTLPGSIYNSYPSDMPGKYANFTDIETYGSTCAAWDQSPNTPWYEYCPTGADWCAYDYNWCQEPWCYVDKECPTAVASSVFKGSDTAYYSYDTCLSTPDCYTNSTAGKRADLPASCPFDKADNGWQTAKACSAWTVDTATTTVPVTTTAAPGDKSEVSAAAGAAISGAVALASAALYALAA
mmetsp:Transcript_21566/g.64336  ORF Transcript_21566/g.64336 Transcript_21566/m.64336 type:complete len:344 (-) Transcript_21566:64-1095(-)